MQCIEHVVAALYLSEFKFERLNQFSTDRPFVTRCRHAKKAVHYTQIKTSKSSIASHPWNRNHVRKNRSTKTCMAKPTWSLKVHAVVTSPRASLAISETQAPLQSRPSRLPRSYEDSSCLNIDRKLSPASTLRAMSAS